MTGFSFLARATCALILGLLATGLAAQSLNRDLTDPNAIAQECGGSADAGKPLFATACAACHSLTPEAGQSMPGPHLAEIYGRSAASVPDYSYSPAAQDLFVVWEGETLHRLLSGEIALPAHPVVAEDQTRRDILTYLRTETRPAPPDMADVTVPEALLAMQGDPDYGEYLASDCSSCHNASAQDQGGPDLTALPRAEFLRLMQGYRLRALPNPVMQVQAGRLSDEELAALAAYFERATN